MMFQFGLIIVLDCCAIVLGRKEIVYWSIHIFYYKICVKYSFIIAPLMQHLQPFSPSQQLYDVMFDKEPVSLSEPERM